MDKGKARKNLLANLHLVIKGLEMIGIPPLKARDKREPGRLEKQKYEEELMTVIVNHFLKQRRAIRERITGYAFMRTAPALNFDYIYDDKDLIAQLMLLLERAAKDGIILFAKNSGAQIDWALTNKRAIEWAKKYTYDLVKDIDDTTRKVLQSVISQFAETPGMTIGDVMDLLPFDEDRAFRVAVTEITRAYATANQFAGEDLKKEFPDVRVVKTWFTNNDDLVCELCGPLEGTEVEIDDNFYDPELPYADGNPPRHVNCRCWTDTTTRLGDKYE